MGNTGSYSKLLKYPNQVMRLNSYGSHLHQYFKKAGSPIKEMAECWAIYKYLIGIKNVKDEHVLVMVVGDGSSPRLGSLLAVMTRWEIISIDPEMKDLEIEEPIDRLTIIDTCIEEVESFITDKDLMIVLPHAHVDTHLVMDKFDSRGERLIIVNPCCMPRIQLLKRAPDDRIKDEYMMGPHCSIYLYRDLSSKLTKEERN